jgi:hypothetical protein
MLSISEITSAINIKSVNISIKSIQLTPFPQNARGHKGGETHRYRLLADTFLQYGSFAFCGFLSHNDSITQLSNAVKLFRKYF